MQDPVKIYEDAKAAERAAVHPIPSFTEFAKIARLSRNCVLSEKLDGTNASIFIADDLAPFFSPDENYAVGTVPFLVGSRNRWITPAADNFGFARFAYANAEELLKLGPGQHFGEWWGCLSSETSVELADGSSIKIGQLVNGQFPVRVKSYNFDTGRIESKRVTGWLRGDRTADWLTVRVKRKWRGGRQVGLHMTPNHVVYRKGHAGLPEQVSANQLRVGDEMYVNAEEPTYIQEQLIRGTMLGDSYVGDGYSLTCGHSNHAYTQTKVRILGPLVTRLRRTRSGKGSEMLVFSTKSIPLLRDLRDALYRDGQKRLLVEYVRSLHPCGMAFWFMDDGTTKESDVRSPVSSICTNGFDYNDVFRVKNWLNESGYGSYVVLNAGRPVIKFTPAGTVALHTTIVPYVSDEMRYKIIPMLRNAPSIWDTPGLVDSGTQNLAMSRVESITRDYAHGCRSKVRYDIQVEDNANFFANNVLVHNSGIQRGYGLAKGEKRFSLFNTARWKPAQEAGTLPACVSLVPVLFEGIFSSTVVDEALARLRDEGSVAAPGFMDPEGVVIYQTAARMYFKKTIKKDEEPKGMKHEQ